VQFSRDLRDDVASGDITVSFRLWNRPKVKTGGRYTVGPVRIEVDSIDLVPFSSVSRGVPLLFLILALGIYPNLIFRITDPAVSSLANGVAKVIG
jgi:NADH:ubiquinone oxidoreductase subunit 4 (subunit M)